MQAYLALRRRQQKFVDAYVECGSGAEAMRRAGIRSKRTKGPFKNPNVAACKLLAKPQIRAAVAEKQDEAVRAAGVTEMQAVLHASENVNFDPRKLIGPDGKLLPMERWPDEIAFSVQGVDVEYDKDGKITAVKPRFTDRTSARRLLLQYLRALPDRHEVTGRDGGPIPVAAATVVAKIDDAEAMSAYLQMLARPPVAK